VTAKAVESEPANRKDDNWSSRSESDKRLEAAVERSALTGNKMMSASSSNVPYTSHTKETKDILFFIAEVKLFGHYNLPFGLYQTHPTVADNALAVLGSLIILVGLKEFALTLDHSRSSFGIPIFFRQREDTIVSRLAVWTTCPI
jgi:hypothetical protein